MSRPFSDGFFTNPVAFPTKVNPLYMASDDSGDGNYGDGLYADLPGHYDMIGASASSNAGYLDVAPTDLLGNGVLLLIVFTHSRSYVCLRCLSVLYVSKCKPLTHFLSVSPVYCQSQESH